MPYGLPAGSMKVVTCRFVSMSDYECVHVYLDVGNYSGLFGYDCNVEAHESDAGR